MKVKNCLYCGFNNLKVVNQRSDETHILECQKCHVMMVDEISDNTEQLYTSEYFEKSADTKSGYTDYLSSPVANVLGKYGLTTLFASKQSVHLDLGCADGSLIEIFKSNGYESRGLEISKDAVNIAKSKGLEVLYSNLHKFPKELTNSDVITAFDLLEHADKPGNVLKEVFKNLNKDGYFVFSTLSVDKRDPADYWFNNSLEHYVYYDEVSLTNVLRDTFGEGRFSFIKISINNISEFWGFAKKGKLKNEDKIIEVIKKVDYFKNDPKQSFKLSLFYNQLGRFSENDKIINNFSHQWTDIEYTLAKFYFYYYQGMYHKALQIADSKIKIMPLGDAVFWQALSYCEKEYYNIHTKDIKSQNDLEVLDLKGQLFNSRQEVQSLRNSRVIGKIIKARESVGEIKPKTKQFPRKAVIKTKHLFSGVAPDAVKPAIRSVVLRPARKVLRAYDKSRSKNSNMHQNGVEYIPNNNWNKKTPLVSIVVPYFNRADTIDETIQSVFAQTFSDHELILVDDGSTDQESVKKLEQLRIDYPTIIILEQKNQGVAAARNNGISKARGKYIVCLDSDDIIDPTYVEKCLIVLELNQDIGLTTTYRKDFGVITDEFRGAPYEPIELFKNNMVTTAAMFRKKAWEVSGGYKSDIGYEDWEFWLTLAEHGFWGKLLPEFLFSYRVAMSSRFMEDKEAHWNNIKIIQNMHKQYAKKIKQIASQRRVSKLITTKETLFQNLSNKVDYHKQDNKKPRVLVTIPWMTFGGAETLIYNYCQEIKSGFNITFMTGLESKHEWEYKFKEITPNVYHLANLFEDKQYYLEFILNYIKTRDIQILHIIHNGFTFEMLSEIKKHFPDLKVIVTMFNDRVDYFLDSTNYSDYINVYTSDNSRVTKHYQEILGNSVSTRVIPNGIDCYSTFRADLFDRTKERDTLGLSENDIAVFFVGRLSEEKNPDVFVEVAKKINLMIGKKPIKFYMIGDGDMRNQIEEMISKSKAKNVRYLGYFNNLEVARLMSAADIFMLPSSIEGFPLSILEAMAMRLAVVASDVGAVAEVLNDGVDGFVVKPGNIEEITKTIIKLESDRDLLRKVKVGARNKVEDNYSNTILGRNYTDLYNGVIK